jgi:hypothetical protein
MRARVQTHADGIMPSRKTMAKIPTVSTMPMAIMIEAFDQIERYAGRCNPNVIMVGAGEKAADGRVFLGTTAARLRRWAVKPEWIVTPESGPPSRRILCPVDMQWVSARALKNAIHFAGRKRYQ